MWETLQQFGYLSIGAILSLMVLMQWLFAWINYKHVLILLPTIVVMTYGLFTGKIGEWVLVPVAIILVLIMRASRKALDGKK